MNVKYLKQIYKSNPRGKLQNVLFPPYTQKLWTSRRTKVALKTSMFSSMHFLMVDLKKKGKPNVHKGSS